MYISGIFRQGHQNIKHELPYLLYTVPIKMLFHEDLKFKVLGLKKWKKEEKNVEIHVDLSNIPWYSHVLSKVLPDWSKLQHSVNRIPKDYRIYTILYNLIIMPLDKFATSLIATIFYLITSWIISPNFHFFYMFFIIPP